MITVNNRDKLDWQAGMTVSDVLKRMKYDYSLISVYIDEKYIPEEEYNSRAVPDKSSIQVIHLAHGG
jgi:thiamine biosynthesis protein ThiS